MTARPTAPVRSDLAPAAVRPEPRRERAARNGSACGLVISATARSAAAASTFRPSTATDDRRQRGQHVDRLVLAPPGADVDDRRVEQDDGGRDDRPARPVARSAYATSAARPRSASEAGVFISARIAGSAASVDRLEGRLDRRQDAPDVGHDRRERQVLVVGVAEAVDRDAVDPAGRTGRGRRAAPASAAAATRIDDAGDERRRAERGDVSVGGPALGRGVRRSRLRRGRSPSTARRSRRPRRARPSSVRTPGRRRPSARVPSNSRSIWLS